MRTHLIVIKARMRITRYRFQNEFLEYDDDEAGMLGDSELKPAKQERETAKKYFDIKKAEYDKWLERKANAENKMPAVVSEIRNLKAQIRQLEKGAPVASLAEEETQLDIDFSTQPYPILPPPFQKKNPPHNFLLHAKIYLHAKNYLHA